MIVTKMIADHKGKKLPTKMIGEMIGDYEKTFSTKMIDSKMIARGKAFFVPAK